MTLTFTKGMCYGKPCFRMVANIEKSKKHNINTRIQKTWRAGYGNSMFTKEQLRKSFEAEALRWHAKMMAKLFPSGDAPPELKQVDFV